MYRTLSAALLALAVLALGSIATPVAAQEATTDDAPRFDPTTRTCVHEPSDRDGRRWVTLAPRDPAHPASLVTLGLSGGKMSEAVTATVTAPDGGKLAVSDSLTQRGSTGLAYPISPALPGPESTVPGVYTVVWTDAWGTFLACDGFVVER
jgi:methionine-rich copper-binding protein CopC